VHSKDRANLQLAGALIVVSGDDWSSLTGNDDAKPNCPRRRVARAFVKAAQSLSLDDFFDQTLPAEPLVV
jgi:hypothetical protein